MKIQRVYERVMDSDHTPLVLGGVAIAAGFIALALKIAAVCAGAYCDVQNDNSEQAMRIAVSRLPNMKGMP